MSLTKNQIDLFIEREAEKASYPPYFIEAAQLLAPLLLQAVEAFRKLRNEAGSLNTVVREKNGIDWDQCDMCAAADVTLSQIEAAVLNTVKGGAK